jgi:polyisoprenoid-binding protein YceI
MPKYTVGGGSKVTVRARSAIHDTTTVWDRVAGDVDAAADTLASAGATARFTVDMSKFDAGDWLKNRKLRSDFELEKHPQATFELGAVRDVVRTGDRGYHFSATAEGTLHWRGKSVPLTIKGTGSLDDRTIRASGSFELDIRTLGLAAPKFLMFKVEDQVTVEVVLEGTAR